MLKHFYVAEIRLSNYRQVYAVYATGMLHEI